MSRHDAVLLLCCHYSCDSLVSTLDLVPLFHHTIGEAVAACVQGVDLRPLLADPARAALRPPRDLVFSENLGRAMVFDGEYKYDASEDNRQIRNHA